jgi:hypothetical protein
MNGRTGGIALKVKPEDLAEGVCIKAYRAAPGAARL